MMALLHQPVRRRSARNGLLRDRSAVSIVEFALGLPLLLGFSLGGLEMANYILAANTTQRLATMVADLVAQSGVGGISTTESQLYDVFNAIDVSAQPLDMRTHGRVIFSVIKGVTQGNGTVRNEFVDGIYSQQFDGGYVSVTPLLGCHTSSTTPTFSRTLPSNELLVHAQVTYIYQPLFSNSLISYFHAPSEITRTATFRMRKNRFNITNDANHPAKNKCNTATGL